VDVPEVDAFTFPPALGNGITPVRLVPAKVSFDITYTKSGKPRRIRAASRDPLSPLRWAGKMWDATNSGTFSVTYDDGTFAASGTFSSSGNFGEMGTERNGSFLRGDDLAKADSAATGPISSPSVIGAVGNQYIKNATIVFGNAPRLKGRLMVPSTTGR
jgi:hypothetical protein